jgi:hypothetical protein
MFTEVPTTPYEVLEFPWTPTELLDAVPPVILAPAELVTVQPTPLVFAANVVGAVELVVVSV